MLVKHNFVELAELQRLSRTLYCAGIDIHGFGNLKNALDVYGYTEKDAVYNFYSELAKMSSRPCLIVDYMQFAHLLAGIEDYVCRRIITTLVEECNIYIFKLQLGLFMQFGPVGMFLLQRINNFILRMEEQSGQRIIRILDCKCGDIATTQEGYFTGFMGDLSWKWGIQYTPFDFDIINVTLWVGTDGCLLEDKAGNPLLGSELMYNGKGIFIVNKTSNPSGPMYQEFYLHQHTNKTLQLGNAHDAYNWNKKFDLEFDGLSALGLVVGATHPCDGSTRKAFPTTTLLVPGFGAQGGFFSYIMPELIKTGQWKGQGAIFSLSRATMFPFLRDYGGSGDVQSLENDLIASVKRFRNQEKTAYQESSIPYPF